MAPVGWWQVGGGENDSLGTGWNVMQIFPLSSHFQNLIPLFPCAAFGYFQCKTRPVITKAAHIQDP